MARRAVADRQTAAEPAGRDEPPAPLEGGPLTAADLLGYVDRLAADLGVAEPLRPRWLRVRSYEAAVRGTPRRGASS